MTAWQPGFSEFISKHSLAYGLGNVCRELFPNAAINSVPFNIKGSVFVLETARKSSFE